MEQRMTPDKVKQLHADHLKKLEDLALQAKSQAIMSQASVGSADRMVSACLEFAAAVAAYQHMHRGGPQASVSRMMCAEADVIEQFKHVPRP